MKLLLFSDLHINLKLAKELVQKSYQVDVVIGAGDFAIMHQGLQETIDVLKTITKPTLVIPGNGETYQELQMAISGWDSCLALHGTGTQINGVSYYGIGGGIPVTPFGDWSFDFTEDEAVDLLYDMPEGGVLISHSPPKNILDLASSGKNLGSTTIRNIIDVKKPKLVVCGHIHESGGRQQLHQETLVVNAGPGGIVIELNA